MLWVILHLIYFHQRKKFVIIIENLNKARRKLVKMNKKVCIDVHFVYVVLNYELNIQD
jgi:hypothetical protein